MVKLHKKLIFIRLHNIVDQEETYFKAEAEVINKLSKNSLE
jgi:hypothetical protein